MACVGCSSGADGKVSGCKSNGGCATGGCNRMNSYDWIAVLDLEDPDPYPYVEVSFKNGTFKEFYRKDSFLDVITGDYVVVETASGQDVGKVTLSGELVRLQMKKKSYTESRVLYKIVRLATDRDLDHMQQAREVEKMALVKGRAIARSMDLDMKLSDVAYQADLKKGTFYYIADRRIDFRELVRVYAKEFRIKIEMRQIGARQESARIGGIGSCGRELCCSTWLSDFKTVVTSAARYQNLAINQTKLSGQCGRLKCCLNYELDVYMESLERFPMEIEFLVSKLGRANLVKTDIFRGVMYYEIESQSKASRDINIFGLSPEQVKALKVRNEKGEIPPDFGETISMASLSSTPPEEDAGYADVTGEIELPEEKRRKNKNRGNNRSGNNPQQNQRPANQDRSQRPSQTFNSNQGPKTNQDNRNNPNQKPNQPNSPRENRPPQNQSRNNPNQNRPGPQRDQQNPNQNRPPSRPPFNKDRNNPENKRNTDNNTNTPNQKDN
jgi:cell fate regulator YaaT (PSP1 superfamily)